MSVAGRPVSDARVPVILCVDVEPDDHVYDPQHPSPWRGFEMLADWQRRLRGSLAALTGEPARFSWSLRMDPQIAEAYGTPAWVTDRYRPILDEVRDGGDALGIHPHAWRWDRDARVWVSDHADQAWVDHCVEISHGTYRDAFGEGPAYHRFGSLFTSSATMNRIRSLRIPIDITVEPGERPIQPGEFLGGVLTGGTPDFANAPRVPYRPDPSDFLRPSRGGTNGLWEIPLSSGSLALKARRYPSLHLGKNWDRVIHPARTARSFARRVRSVVGSRTAPRTDPAGQPAIGTLRMWLAWRSPADFWDAAFDVVNEIEHPYLAFAIRSDLPLHHREFRNFEAIIRHLQGDPRARRLAFTTPEDALRRLGLMNGTESPGASWRGGPEERSNGIEQPRG